MQELELNALHNLTDSTSLAIVPSTRQTRESTLEHSSLARDVFLGLLKAELLLHTWIPDGLCALRRQSFVLEDRAR